MIGFASPAIFLCLVGNILVHCWSIQGSRSVQHSHSSSLLIYQGSRSVQHSHSSSLLIYPRLEECSAQSLQFTVDLSKARGVFSTVTPVHCWSTQGSRSVQHSHSSSLLIYPRLEECSAQSLQFTVDLSKARGVFSTVTPVHCWSIQGSRSVQHSHSSSLLIYPRLEECSAQSLQFTVDLPKARGVFQSAFCYFLVQILWSYLPLFSCYAECKR